MIHPASGSTFRHDVAAAVAIALALTFAWAVRDWTDLSALRLPDTDDAVRLQQIRDWLAGQPFDLLTQFRLADGLAMHWSRLPDLIPGGLIVLLRPILGQHGAELAMVIAWPALLFAAALALLAWIARTMEVPPLLAVVIGALAFPATAMFMPGRIDHHGFQLVLLLAMMAALLAPRGIASGVGIALAGVASLVIGIETAPFTALAGILAVLGWIAGRTGAARQLLALGGTALTALLAARLVFAPQHFGWQACDGFTSPVWLAALAGAAAPLLLGACDRLVDTRAQRLGLAIATGALAGAAALWAAPSCLAPYGGVDPILTARWLSQVGEAQPMFAATPATMLAQCGVMLAGLGAGVAAAHRTRDPGWAILALFQTLALALTVWQLRSANAGALLGVPALAWLVAAARRRGPLALFGAWLGAAGILYPLAAKAIPERAEGMTATCDDARALAALNSLRPGLVAGPIDLGAWGLAATRHRFLAAPYHRNTAGNAAAFAILDGPRGPALATARRWRVDYLVVCGPTPAWLRGDLPEVQAGNMKVFAPRATGPIAGLATR